MLSLKFTEPEYFVVTWITYTPNPFPPWVGPGPALPRISLCHRDVPYWPPKSRDWLGSWWSPPCSPRSLYLISQPLLHSNSTSPAADLRVQHTQIFLCPLSLYKECGDPDEPSTVLSLSETRTITHGIRMAMALFEAKVRQTSDIRPFYHPTLSLCAQAEDVFLLTLPAN